jgi:hypothetical protein
MTRQIHVVLTLLILTACITTPTPAPTVTPAGPSIITAEDNAYAPKPGDNGLERTGVILTSINLTERSDLDPVRVELNLFGSLPSVCNELRVAMNPPNERYEIFIEVYSVVNANLDCENVFRQFEASLLFGVYSSGRYTVWVNDGLIGDFVVF